MSSTNPAVQPWLSPATATAQIMNGLTGVVTFNVTADVAAVLAGSWPGHGWLLKKVDESQSGSVEFESGQGAPAPRLVLTIERPDPPMDAGTPVDAGVQRTPLVSIADNYVRQGSPNQNAGTESILRIQASGRNRAILNFDPAQIQAALGHEHLVHARLELTITETFNNWGSDRSIGVHRIRQDWTELGSTWNCALDTNTANASADCSGSTSWVMWAPSLPEEQVAWSEAPTDTDIISSGQTGVVRFDVTQDVACYLAGHLPWHGFLVKKEAENQSGHVEFASRETQTPAILLLEHTTGPGVTVTQEHCTGILPDGGTVDAGTDAGNCTPTGQTDEDCDGVDDDCDGLADDAFQITPTTCGTGACTGTGDRTCENGSLLDSCTPGAPASSDTTCNGIDEDCSGAPDEDYVVQSTSCGVGACASAGSTSCVNGAVQDSCTPSQPSGSDGTCNGVDDDCNGGIDEDYVAQNTTCGVGQCVRAGTTSCSGGTEQDSCVAGQPGATDASCNGLDDDCNGANDEDFLSQPTLCGVGACASTGSTSCVSGAAQDSCTSGTPAANDASCDGVDNDCSGSVDEDFDAQSTSCGLGACASTGTRICVNGAVQDSCAPGSPAGSDDSCNGVDDDCSGAVDEDYAAHGTSCGIGACARAGVTSCVNGSLQNSCSPGVPDANDATCDAIDDDCDASLDEAYVPQATSCGVGACASTGTTSCVLGSVQNSCTAGNPGASDATCDAIDDDCNGTADEGYRV